MGSRLPQFRLLPDIWQRRWGFKPSEVNLLRPVAQQLAEQGYGPVLNEYLFIARTQPKFLKGRFARLKTALSKRLRPFDLDIPMLFDLLEPAVFFHTFWFYEMNRREDKAHLKERKHRHLVRLLRDQSSDRPVLRLSAEESADLVRRLQRENARDGYPLPNIKLKLNPRHVALLKKHLQARLFRGEQVYSEGIPRSYSVHKAPIWKTTMKVLADLLSAEERPGRETLVYNSLHFLFPDVFEIELLPAPAAKFIRERIEPPWKRRAKRRESPNWSRSMPEILAQEKLLLRSRHQRLPRRS